MRHWCSCFSRLSWHPLDQKCSKQQRGTLHTLRLKVGEHLPLCLRFTMANHDSSTTQDTCPVDRTRTNSGYTPKERQALKAWTGTNIKSNQTISKLNYYPNIFPTWNLQLAHSKTFVNQTSIAIIIIINNESYIWIIMHRNHNNHY